MDKFNAGWVGFLAGTVALVGVALYTPPAVNRTEIFPRDNKPAVMRMYKNGRDGIYLQSPIDKNHYNITLKQHLKKIENKADREIEETEIKRAVGWYDE